MGRVTATRVALHLHTFGMRTRAYTLRAIKIDVCAIDFPLDGFLIQLIIAVNTRHGLQQWRTKPCLTSLRCRAWNAEN